MWLNLPSDDHQVFLHLPMGDSDFYSLSLSRLTYCHETGQWHVMFLQEFFLGTHPPFVL